MEAEVATASERYTIISTDSHVSPPLHDMRQFCPSDYRSQYDEFVRQVEATRDFYTGLTGEPRNQWITRLRDPGVNNAKERLVNMDQDGIAAEVIFHGNPLPVGGGVIPFVDLENDKLGIAEGDKALQTLGKHIFNEWLVSFCAEDPVRLIGVAELPYWDIEAAAEEVKWAASQGLRAVNFAAPRQGMPTYDDPVWEPFWTVVEEAGVVLNCHSGVKLHPFKAAGAGARALYLWETRYASRTPLAVLTYSSVFERHPGLRLIFNEGRVDWVWRELQDLDGIYMNPSHESIREALPMKPSEYWQRNCFAGGSFLAHFELQHRHEIGINTITWGRDYPHLEGTWPHTMQALRSAFFDVPMPEVREILTNAPMRCYSLDRDQLVDIGRRIGPSPDQISVELQHTPEGAWCWGFRDREDALGGGPRLGAY